MKTVSGELNGYKYEYTLEYVDVMDFYRSNIKIYEKSKINPTTFYILIKKVITGSTEKEVEQDSLIYIKRFIKIYNDGSTTNKDCNHEYIPLFSSYACKYCGKEK